MQTQICSVQIHTLCMYAHTYVVLHIRTYTGTWLMYVRTYVYYVKDGVAPETSEKDRLTNIILITIPVNVHVYVRMSQLNAQTKCTICMHKYVRTYIH